MQATLEVDIQKDGTSVSTLELPKLKPHQRCVFGRGDTADVKLEHASLSRHHAQLAVSLDGRVTLTDLGSCALLANGIPCQLSLWPGHMGFRAWPGAAACM